MGISLNEINMYKNFDELAQDILEMAQEFFPGKLLFLSNFSNNKQIILKLSDKDTDISLNEGMSIELNQTVCNKVDFKQNKPLMIEDIKNEPILVDLRNMLEEANIHSYVGVPITVGDGEAFGTLCAVHNQESEFSNKSVKMLQRIARMFSYYLELERLAFRDSLTGLYNRYFLSKYFDHYSVKEGAIFFLDLDGFKTINDKYGHEKGDLILKEAALRLETFLKQKLTGFAVRLGGDEFVIVIENVTSKESLTEISENILTLLSTWDKNMHESQLSVSIGIDTYTSKEKVDVNSLLKNADQALYRAKSKGKNRYQFFS
ncbi:sensor domain-containing diguanylate cyclase [Metabacillus halosaccharovorans]|uniref:sensor domain-containing diguanylate cyclase n=1 Tax=Metabacillus halosaccharovorans TaxID=930124 RepID=UPI00203F413D|nr:diguanylate cyclase [Metabacillus halosaccharovorans]MCM3442307.1 diguanylate cyclase [Metabacillus halosaccharovorans]